MKSDKPAVAKEKKPYRTPTITIYGAVHSITGTRSGSGNDLLDTRRLGTEPTK